MPRHRATWGSAGVNAAHSDLVACNHCALIQKRIVLSEGQESACARCGHALDHDRGNWLSVSCALVVTGTILFAIVLSLPFIGIEALGVVQSTTLLSGVYGLLLQQQWLLASLVFLTIFLLPLIELGALGFVLFSRWLNKPNRWAIKAMLMLYMVRPWSMLEIFLLGVVVTAVKVGDLADLVLGQGVVAFAALVVVLIAINTRINKVHLWNWLNPHNHFTASGNEALVSCGACEALIGESVIAENKHCPRCGGTVESRIPHSLQKTTALLIAAVILYIPANALPIMTVTTFGAPESNTIIGGVILLFHEGMWGIALVVFVASVLVPVLKMLVMAYLIWSAHRSPKRGHKARTKMFHITEFVGRWSMVDVFVVTLLVAMVQFGVLMNIDAGAATLAFASVVVLTMLAAETFDSRLLWDNNDE